MSVAATAESRVGDAEMSAPDDLQKNLLLKIQTMNWQGTCPASSKLGMRWISPT